MSAPIVERSTGDIIPASDHNDVKDYIEDGIYRVNTKSLNIQGIGEIIDLSGNITTNVGTVDGIDIATDVAANTLKNTNVTTNITVVEAPTNVDIQSSDGTNDTIAAADGTNAGVMTTTMYDEHVVNNGKVTYPGMDWSDPVDTDIIPDTISTHDLGSTAKKFDYLYTNYVAGGSATDRIDFLTSGTIKILTDTTERLTITDSGVQIGAGATINTIGTTFVDNDTSLMTSQAIKEKIEDYSYSTTVGTVTSVAALTLGTTGTDLSSTVATGTTTPVITLNVPTASAANRGVLSSADWSTFNGKSSTVGTVTSVTSANGAATIATTTTTPVITIVSSPKLTTARTIGGVSFDGTANIIPTTIAVTDTADATCFVGLWESATGDLLPQTDAGITYAADTAILTVSGSIASDVTGALTGNADTVTNATLTTALTVNTGTLTLTADAGNDSVLTIGGGAVSVSGANTGDNSANSSTMFIGTTEVALNRATAALTLAGITLTTPDIGTPSAGTLTNCTFPTLNQSTTGTAAIATTITLADESADTSCNVLFATAATGNLGAKTGTNLTFNSSTGLLTATGFAGALTGNVTGDITGNAGTVTTITGLAPDTATTQATQPNITSLGTLTSLAVTNNITVGGTVDGIDIATDVAANTLKNTNVSTNITVVEAPTNVSIQSSDGTNDTIAAADVTNAGVMTTTMYDEHVVNNGKVSYNSTASTKLGTIEESADVTDTANVTSAGALMDSELTSIADVKALNQSVTTTSSPTFAAITAGNLLNSADATDYIDMDTSGWIRFKLNSTSVLSLNDTQVIALADVVPNTDSTYSLGTTANRWSNFFTDAITCGGNIAVGGTVDGIDIATDVGANNSKVTNATHSGEVTGSTALTIAANVVDEANMKISNGPTNDYILTADSGATGGWKWAEAGGGADDSARTSAGLNLIRELQDRSVTFSADGADMFGDAYIDTTGRMNYVDTGETDATFDTNKYRPATSAQYWSSAGGDTLSTTYVTMATFSNAGILVQEVQYSQYRTGSNTTTAYGKVIFTYTDDSTAEDEQSTTSTNTPVVRTITNPNLAKLVKSVSFQAKTSDGGRQAYMNAITLDNVLPTEFLIYHDIPTGTFGATISSAHATALVADWEAGADIQFKLTGTSGTEDSGWLDYNTTTDFTAFTAEPDTFIVKLVAKTTSPTPGYPAIHGAIVKAE